MKKNTCACGVAIHAQSKMCRPCKARSLRNHHTAETQRRITANRDPGPHYAICEYCHAGFLGGSAKARFCSRAHYMRYWRAELYIRERRAIEKETA